MPENQKQKPRRKTPRSKQQLFGKFDTLNDDQFLEFFEGAAEYYKTNFTEGSGDDLDESESNDDRGNNDDGGWLSRIFGE